MSGGFLDQAAIDKLEQELYNLNEKKALAQSAKDKVKVMYLDTVKFICPNNMNSLEEIGVIINDINLKITPNSKYYASFNKLKSNYVGRV